jgi:hypothetical protein
VLQCVLSAHKENSVMVDGCGSAVSAKSPAPNQIECIKRATGTTLTSTAIGL